MQRHEGGYYVRLAVVDTPRLGGDDRHAHGRPAISIEAIMQKGPAKA